MYVTSVLFLSRKRRNVHNNHIQIYKGVNSSPPGLISVSAPGKGGVLSLLLFFVHFTCTSHCSCCTVSTGCTVYSVCDELTVIYKKKQICYAFKHATYYILIRIRNVKVCFTKYGWFIIIKSAL